MYDSKIKALFKRVVAVNEQINLPLPW